MNPRFAKLLSAVLAVSLAFSLRAAVSAPVQTPPAAGSGYFKLGTTRNPAGHEISVDSRSSGETCAGGNRQSL